MSVTDWTYLQTGPTGNDANASEKVVASDTWVGVSGTPVPITYPYLWKLWGTCDADSDSKWVRLRIQGQAQTLAQFEIPANAAYWSLEVDVLGHPPNSQAYAKRITRMAGASGTTAAEVRTSNEFDNTPPLFSNGSPPNDLAWEVTLQNASNPTPDSIILTGMTAGPAR